MYCENCGKEVLEAYSYCKFCGSKINKINKNKNLTFCNYCDASVSYGEKFCSSCGREFKNPSDRYEVLETEEIKEDETDSGAGKNFEKEYERYFEEKIERERLLKNYEMLKYMGTKLLGGIKILLIIQIIGFSAFLLYVFINSIQEANLLYIMGYDNSDTYLALFFISLFLGAYIFVLIVTIRGINIGFRTYTIGLARFCLIVFYIFAFFPLSLIFWFLWSRLNNPISKLWCGHKVQFEE
jgi:hypothetical protein